MNKKNIFVVFFISMIICFITDQAFAGRYKNRINNSFDQVDQSGLIEVDNRARTFILHLPPMYNDNSRLPLVIVLHGGGGNGEGAIRMSDMSSKADKEGFIVVYPDGTGKLKNRLLTWNTWNCCAYALKNNVDDVKFIRLLIEKLEKEYHIDSNRIYVTGISNGGMMSYKLACELSDKIAAIAPVAGALNCDNCISRFPVAVIAFHGTADTHVPYYGGAGDNALAPRIDKSVSYAIDFWVKHDACSSVPRKEEFGDIVKETYASCQGNAEVVLYTIKNGGHSWPGGRDGLRYGNADKPTQEISATDLMWEFFANHPKR